MRCESAVPALWNSFPRMSDSHRAHAIRVASPLDAHRTITGPSMNAGPCRLNQSSSSRVFNKCDPRSVDPVAQSGCFSSASNVSLDSLVSNADATWRNNRPGADKGKGRPALSSGMMRQRSNAAVTCRVNVLSGQINAALMPSSAADLKANAIADASARGDGA